MCRKFTVHVNPFGCSESARKLPPVISALLAYPAGHVTCWSSASRTASVAELVINHRRQLSGNLASCLLSKREDLALCCSHQLKTQLSISAAEADILNESVKKIIEE